MLPPLVVGLLLVSFEVNSETVRVNEKKTIQLSEAGKPTTSTVFSNDSNFLPNKTYLWRVNIKASDLKDDNSVRVILQHGHSSTSFKLPYTRTTGRSKDQVKATIAERTVDLCPDPENPVGPSSLLTVNMISSSNTTVNVSLTAMLVTEDEGWMKKNGGEELTGSISLSSPLVTTSRFKPVQGEHYVRLIIESLSGSDSFCSVVSVQRPKCPYSDSISTATRLGQWQTISENTSMVLDARNYTEGFLIVVVAAISDERCDFKHKKLSGRKTNLTKNLKIRMEGMAGSSERATAAFILLGFYLAVIVIAAALSVLQFRYNTVDLLEGNKTTLLQLVLATTKMPLGPENMQPSEDADDKICTETRTEVNGSGAKEQHEVDCSALRLADPIQLEDWTSTISAIIGPEREKKPKASVAAMCTKFNENEGKCATTYRKNDLYLGNLLLISIFYSIAVLQLAFQTAYEQKKSGNNDICYFNSLCQNPLWKMLDFNHFLSNLGYVMFGFLFAVLVYLRRRRYDQFQEQNSVDQKLEIFNEKQAALKELEHKHGIPLQYGIYYSLAGALAMEGLMSGSYHICPTTISFQFDTTFMYLISILIYIKMYQNRHPDISANSVTAYTVLGSALILEALSLYYSNAYFWIVFCLIYMTTLVCWVGNIYQQLLEKNRHTHKPLFVRVFSLLGNETHKYFKKLRGMKGLKIRSFLVFLSLTVVLNLAMCIYFAIHAASKEKGASNYLLLMFMSNMGIYVIYYIVMKYKSGEHLCNQAKLYNGKTLIIADGKEGWFSSASNPWAGIEEFNSLFIVKVGGRSWIVTNQRNIFCRSLFQLLQSKFIP